MACSVTSVTRWRHSVKMPRQNLTGFQPARQREFSSYGTTLSALGIVVTSGSSGTTATTDDHARPDTDGDEALEFRWSRSALRRRLPVHQQHIMMRLV